MLSQERLQAKQLPGEWMPVNRHQFTTHLTLIAATCMEEKRKKEKKKKKEKKQADSPSTAFCKYSKSFHTHTKKKKAKAIFSSPPSCTMRTELARWPGQRAPVGPWKSPPSWLCSSEEKPGLLPVPGQDNFKHILSSISVCQILPNTQPRTLAWQGFPPAYSRIEVNKDCP